MPGFFSSARASFLGLAVLLSTVASCGPNHPRPQKVIQAEIEALPGLYRVEQTGEEIVAPGNAGDFAGLVIVDEDSGQLAWRVMECTAPDCPARGPNGEFHQFTCPIPTAHVGGDGKVKFAQEPTEEGLVFLARGCICPECMRAHDLENAPLLEQQLYAAQVQRHILPETVKRREELAVELERRRAYVSERITPPTEGE